MANPIAPTTQQAELLATLPQDQPVIMINLLKFKPDGLEHYETYAREVQVHLDDVGARALYAGSAKAFVIGEGPRPWWDAILVVQYPTPAAFVSMVTSEAYADVHVHRANALERAELIATNEWTLSL
ncbi:MAG TPA: DUF1330 domain-containing protein [Solirubrobacteraceae bacterium]|nr:DUF1330 domain-containing protein [Solirubrobacteraceae bacterium]